MMWWPNQLKSWFIGDQLHERFFNENRKFYLRWCKLIIYVESVSKKNALALLEMFSPNAWNGITYLFHHLVLGHLILYNCNIRHFTFNTAHYTYYHFCRNRLYESRIYTSNGQKRRNAQTFLLSRGGDNILWSNGGLDGCQGGMMTRFFFYGGPDQKRIWGVTLGVTKIALQLISALYRKTPKSHGYW